MKVVTKPLCFALLIAIFWACGGFVSAAESSMQRLHITIELAYLAGAIVALWVGDKSIGTLQPVSLRPIFITLGSIMMIGAFCTMLVVRSEKVGYKPLSNQSAQPMPGDRRGSNRAPALRHGWPHRSTKTSKL